MKDNSLSDLFIHSLDIYFCFSKCKIHEGAKPEHLLDDSCITVHLLDIELYTWKEWILWYVNYTFDCVDHSTLWKILKEMGIQDHLTSWEICMQVRKQQLELDMEQQTGSK